MTEEIVDMKYEKLRDIIEKCEKTELLTRSPKSSATL